MYDTGYVCLTTRAPLDRNSPILSTVGIHSIAAGGGGRKVEGRCNRPRGRRMDGIKRMARAVFFTMWGVSGGQCFKYTLDDAVYQVAHTRCGNHSI